MHIFCLELWLGWIKDELPLACLPEHRKMIISLFELGVKDYQCKEVIKKEITEMKRMLNCSMSSNTLLTPLMVVELF